MYIFNQILFNSKKTWNYVDGLCIRLIKVSQRNISGETMWGMQREKEGSDNIKQCQTLGLGLQNSLSSTGGKVLMECDNKWISSYLKTLVEGYGDFGWQNIVNQFHKLKYIILPKFQ